MDVNIASPLAYKMIFLSRLWMAYDSCKSFQRKDKLLSTDIVRTD